VQKAEAAARVFIARFLITSAARKPEVRDFKLTGCFWFLSPKSRPGFSGGGRLIFRITTLV